jgi:hypothetical protein
VDHDNYAFVMNADGSGRKWVTHTSITDLIGMSPDRRLVFAMAPVAGCSTTDVLAMCLRIWSRTSLTG